MTPTMTGYWPSQLPAQSWKLEWGAAALEKLKRVRLPVIHWLPEIYRSELQVFGQRRRYRIYCTINGTELLLVVEPRGDESGNWKRLQVITIEKDQHRKLVFEVKDLF